MFNASRRDFVKKTAYVAPAILTLKAMPAFAQSGSNNGWGNGDQSAPGGSLPNNNAENNQNGTIQPIFGEPNPN